MKKILFIKTVMLAACLSARASGPSVAITTSFTMSGDTAVTCKTAPTGDFTATPKFEPDDKVEIIIDGLQFRWTIAPSENVSFLPTDAVKVNVGLADNAFGKNYDVSVIVTWIVWDKVILDFRIITATDSMTLAAFTIALDTVEGADYIGTVGVPATLYYATSRKDGDAVIIKLKTVPAVDYIFIPAVTWSGGAEGVNQMERVVSRSTLCESGVFVTAHVGTTSVFIGRVYVFRAKPDETDVLIEKTEFQNNEFCSAADFGIVIFNGSAAPNTEYGTYYEAGFWKFVFKKATYVLGWGVTNCDRTDLPETEVNADPFPVGWKCPNHNTEKQKKECAQTDLDPDKYSSIGRPSREHYWSSAFSIRHEKFHMTDYHDNFYTVQLKLAEQNFESDNNADKVTITTLNPDEQLSSKKLQMDRRIPAYADKAGSAFKADNRHEDAAFGDGRESYLALVNAIKP